jgi:23S rRNA-/tRNA-specific pseudouridylate synthase
VVSTHECGLIAVEKPDGILSHPNPGEVAEKGTILITGNYSLDEESFHVRDGKGGIRRVYLLNRLDSPTSGTLLLSLDEGVADLVRKMFARSQVSKKYVALIRGRGLRTPRGTWQDQMAKSKGPGGGVRSETGTGVPAVTVYAWQRSAGGSLPLSLIQLEPRTGRTHQLRVQSAAHGHPILGDRTYGDFEFNKAVGTARGFKRLFLHAESTQLSFDWQGTKVDFKAASPMPKAFEEALVADDDETPGKGPKRPRRDAGTPISPRLRIRL